MTYGTTRPGLSATMLPKLPVKIAFGQAESLQKLALSKEQRIVFDLLKDHSVIPEAKTLQEKRFPKQFLEKCLTTTDLKPQTFEAYLEQLPQKDAKAFLDEFVQNPLFKKIVDHTSKGSPFHIETLSRLRAALTGKPREYQSESLAVTLAKQFQQDMFQPHKESILTDYVKHDRREALKDAFTFLDYGLQNYAQNGSETGVRRNLLTIFDEIASTDKGKAYLEGLRESLDHKMLCQKLLFDARQRVAHPLTYKESLSESLQQMVELGQSTDTLAQTLANRGVTFVMPGDRYFSTEEITAGKETFTPHALDSDYLLNTYESIKQTPLNTIDSVLVNETESLKTMGDFVDSLAPKDAQQLLELINAETQQMEQTSFIQAIKSELNGQLSNSLVVNHMNGNVLTYDWGEGVIGKLGKPFGPLQDTSFMEKVILKTVNDQVKALQTPAGVYPEPNREFKTLEDIFKVKENANLPEYYVSEINAKPFALSLKTLMFNDNRFTARLLNNIVNETKKVSLEKALDTFFRQNNAGNEAS